MGVWVFVLRVAQGEIWISDLYSSDSTISVGGTPSMAICLWRLEDPDTNSIDLRGTLRRFARNRMSSSLAAPSTGGAFTRILIASPCRPTTSVLEARG